MKLIDLTRTHNDCKVTINLDRVAYFAEIAGYTKVGFGIDDVLNVKETLDEIKEKIKA